MFEVSQYPGAADVWQRPLEPEPVGWLQPPEQAYVGCFPEMMRGVVQGEERRGPFQVQLQAHDGRVLTFLGTHRGPCGGHLYLGTGFMLPGP